MLQAYATIKILKKMNINYEIIRFRREKSLVNYIKCIPLLLNPLFYDEIIYRIYGIQKKYFLRKNPEFVSNNLKRNQTLAKFWEDNFKYVSPEINKYKKLFERSRKYNACLVGSDQLWRPKGMPDDIFTLMFTDDAVIRISYATSFGISKIPYFMTRKTACFLKRFNYLSVRENQGRLLIKELINREASVVLDPTMLFDADDWKTFFPEKKIYHEPYVFVYLLGNNRLHRECITLLAKRRNLKIVCLRHLDEYISEDEKFGDYAPYNVDPVDFVNLIRYADCICTDSFHGTVFSILHKKQFIVFNRFPEKSKISTNSRIQSLCNNLCLDERRYIGNNTDILEHMNMPIPYDSVYEKLRMLQKRSIEYLENALHCMDET
jgi:hypothetical protein